jgi:hypothetical protein
MKGLLRFSFVGMGVTAGSFGWLLASKDIDHVAVCVFAFIDGVAFSLAVYDFVHASCQRAADYRLEAEGKR